MYYSKLKKIRINQGITLEKLAALTNISKRLFKSLRKWKKKEPINRSDGKNSKSIKYKHC